jgi:hypothetical protein
MKRIVVGLLIAVLPFAAVAQQVWIASESETYDQNTDIGKAMQICHQYLHTVIGIQPKNGWRAQYDTAPDSNGVPRWQTCDAVRTQWQASGVAAAAKQKTEDDFISGFVVKLQQPLPK